MNVGLNHPPMERNVHINIRIFLAVIIYSFLHLFTGVGTGGVVYL